jgi:hypothetical protein
VQIEEKSDEDVADQEEFQGKHLIEKSDKSSLSANPGPEIGG